jgi:hypothetical protein
VWRKGGEGEQLSPEGGGSLGGTWSVGERCEEVWCEEVSELEASS